MKLILYGHTKFKDDSVPLSRSSSGPIMTRHGAGSHDAISRTQLISFSLTHELIIFLFQHSSTKESCDKNRIV